MYSTAVAQNREIVWYVQSVLWNTQELNVLECLSRKWRKFTCVCGLLVNLYILKKRDGELAVLKSMTEDINMQGKGIGHPCACSLRLTFTFLVNCILVKKFSEVSEYIWKGL